MWASSELEMSSAWGLCGASCCGSSEMSHVIPRHVFQTLKSHRWNCNVFGRCTKFGHPNYVRVLVDEAPKANSCVRSSSHDTVHDPRDASNTTPTPHNAKSRITLAKSDNVSAIAQKTYTNGFKCDMEHTLDDGSVEFLVPKDAKTFTITAGQSDYSRDTNVTVTFEISDPISDKVLDSTSLRLNEAKEFSIDVSSVPRLKMKALVEAAPGESRKSDISVIAIWADPKFS